MYKVCLISPFTSDAINTLKILALYCDEIRIIYDVLYSVKPEDEKKDKFSPGDIGIITKVTPFIDKEFELEVQTLINEKILKIENEDFLEGMLGSEKLFQIEDNVFNLISKKPDILIHERKIERDRRGGRDSIAYSFSDIEVENVHKKYISDLSVGSEFDMDFIYRYYSALFTDMLAIISSGNVAVSGSPVLGSFLHYAYNSKSYKEFGRFLRRTNNISPYIAFDILNLTLLDISKFPFEDILEFRYQLRNELEKFREELGKISYDVLVEHDERDLVNLLDEIIKYQIIPSVNDLENKIKHSKIKLLSQLADALKNPTAYVPFIGTVFQMIPLQLAFFLSLGIVSFETAINFVAEQKDLTNNGLYYLVQLRKKTRSARK
jgi:hypothetical protein